jgi:hypothetical protein
MKLRRSAKQTSELFQAHQDSLPSTRDKLSRRRMLSGSAAAVALVGMFCFGGEVAKETSEAWGIMEEVGIAASALVIARSAHNFGVVGSRLQAVADLDELVDERFGELTDELESDAPRELLQVDRDFSDICSDADDDLDFDDDASED